jgi:hypothetical protein
MFKQVIYGIWEYRSGSAVGTGATKYLAFADWCDRASEEELGQMQKQILEFQEEDKWSNQKSE